MLCIAESANIADQTMAIELIVLTIGNVCKLYDHWLLITKAADY